MTSFQISILLIVIGWLVCPGARPYTVHEHNRVTNTSIRSKFTFFLFRPHSYLFNSITMLNACLRVLRCEGERKRTTECINKISENRVPARAWTSPLERTHEACKSTGYVEFTLERALRRSSGRPLYMAPCSSVNFPARADTMSAKSAGSTKFTLERRFPRSSGHQTFWKFCVIVLYFVFHSVSLASTLRHALSIVIELKR